MPKTLITAALAALVAVTVFPTPVLAQAEQASTQLTIR
jgi:hypothetical protein